MAENTVTFTDDTFSDEIQQGLVLVDFWAAWCRPCVDELPHLEALDRELGGEDFEILDPPETILAIVGSPRVEAEETPTAEELEGEIWVLVDRLGHTDRVAVIS